MKKRFFRVTSTFLVAIMLLASIPAVNASSADIWDGTSDTSWYDTTKTSFSISTAEQLAGLAELSSNGVTFEGVTIELGSDIALNTGDSSSWDKTPPANVWKPIGTSESKFAGTFDGKGHTISGIYIYGPGNSACSNVGLFGFVGNDKDYTTIKNLNITNSYMNVFGKAGLLVGRIGELARVENVHANGTVIAIEAYPSTKGAFGANSHTGGVIGFIENAHEVYVSKCSFSGYVEGFCRTGAIVGSSTGTQISIENCFSDATVFGRNRVGGILGHSAATLVDIVGCVFMGEISHTHFAQNYGAMMGGFRATATSELSIEDCYYDATFKTTDNKTGVVSALAPRVAVTEIGIMTSNSTWYTPMADASGEATGNDPDGCEVSATVTGDDALSAFYSKADKDVWEIKEGQPSFKNNVEIGDVTVIANGNFGSGFTWSLDSIGRLTIRGKGNMPNFSLDNFGSLTGSGSIESILPPWSDYTDIITSVKLERGITSVGSYSFYECDLLESVQMYDTVKRIGDHAFGECESLDLITYFTNDVSFSAVTKGAYWDTNAGANTSKGTYSFINVSYVLDDDDDDDDNDDIFYGDANGDGFVDNKDLVRIKKYLAAYDYDTNTSSEAVSAGADANGDGFVDNKDLVRLKKYLAAYDYDTGTSDVVLGPTA